MQSHLGSVVLCLISTYAWLGSKFFETFTRIVVKVYNLCRVKTNRLAVLTVKSGLDPHMTMRLAVIMEHGIGRKKLLDSPAPG